jgi:hypothetical protein
MGDSNCIEVFEFKPTSPSPMRNNNEFDCRKKLAEEINRNKMNFSASAPRTEPLDSPSIQSTHEITFNSPSIPHPTIHINGWTKELEQLLIAWAEKASGYAWLHNKSIALYKNRNLYLAVPAALFAYTSATVTLMTTDYHDAQWRTIVAGLGSLISGILINFQELFTFKELSEQHRLSQLGFLAFFRDISCELSVPKRQRKEASEYVTLKRLEMDKLLEHAPDIPPRIVKEFDEKFASANLHKPDVVSRLQTVVPHSSPDPNCEQKGTLKPKINRSAMNLDFRPSQEATVPWEARADVHRLVEIANSETSSDRDTDDENELVIIPNTSSQIEVENDGSGTIRGEHSVVSSNL